MDNTVFGKFNDAKKYEVSARNRLSVKSATKFRPNIVPNPKNSSITDRTSQKVTQAVVKYIDNFKDIYI